MTILNLSRLFDVSKAISTQAGTQLSEMIVYLSQFVDQSSRALKKGLRFEDNFNGTVITPKLHHGVEISIALSGTPLHVFPTRVIGPLTSDSETEPLPQIAWFIRSQKTLSITPYFRSTNASKAYEVQLVVLYV